MVGCVLRITRMAHQHTLVNRGVFFTVTSLGLASPLRHNLQRLTPRSKAILMQP